MSTEKQVLAGQIPKNYGKIPEGYNFSTKGQDWSDYKKDYLLRTDAVWEKYALTDWFRAYTKCFYFDKGVKNYRIFEPEDIYTVLFEGWAIDDVKTFPGFTPTGRTNSFQVGIGPKQRVAVPTQTWYHMQDYYMLCGMRFERWNRCDQIFHEERTKKFDTNSKKEGKEWKRYPCYRQYYEATNACQDDMFDFLMELSFSRRANDTFETDHSAHETARLPTFFDTPNAPDRRTKFY